MRNDGLSAYKKACEAGERPHGKLSRSSPVKLVVQQRSDNANDPGNDTDRNGNGRGCERSSPHRGNADYGGSPDSGADNSGGSRARRTARDGACRESLDDGRAGTAGHTCDGSSAQASQHGVFHLPAPRLPGSAPGGKMFAVVENQAVVVLAHTGQSAADTFFAGVARAGMGRTRTVCPSAKSSSVAMVMPSSRR